MWTPAPRVALGFGGAVSWGRGELGRGQLGAS
jgi:hypothetical protein